MFHEFPRRNEFSGMLTASFRGIRSAFSDDNHQGLWGTCNTFPGGDCEDLRSWAKLRDGSP